MALINHSKINKSKIISVTTLIGMVAMVMVSTAMVVHLSAKKVEGVAA
jgi:hypothetical protein